MRNVEKELERKSHRDAGNEAILIWSLLGSLASIALIIYDPRRLFGGFELPQWASLGFLIAAVIAYFWYLHAKRDIAKAKFEFEMLQRDTYDNPE